MSKSIAELEDDLYEAKIYCLGEIGGYGKEHSIACRRASIALDEAKIAAAAEAWNTRSHK